MNKVEETYKALIMADIHTVTTYGAEVLVAELEKRGWVFSPQDTPTGTGPFTAVELFPLDNGFPKSDCTECGSYVKIQQQTRHTQWHNKVADL